jgi:hypothetical protein
MGVIESIKRGFSITAKSKNLVILLFAFGFVWNLINIPFTGEEGPTSTGASIVVLILSVLFILISIFMQSGSLGFVREVVQKGQSNIQSFTNNGKKFYMRLLGVSVIVGLFIVVLSIMAALVILMGGENPNILSLIIAGVVFLAGVYGIVLLFLAPYILVSEDARVIDALKNSMSFVRQGLSHAVGVLCVLFAIIIVPMYAILPNFRKSKIGQSNLVRFLVISAGLVVIGFAIGLVLGTIFGLLGGIITGVISQVLFGFFSSLVNAYLGVVVTGTFMSYYLSSKVASQPAS